MSTLIEVILYFRTNKCITLADIRKDFLMIKLDSVIDKNKICFFMKEDERLVTYTR